MMNIIRHARRILLLDYLSKSQYPSITNDLDTYWLFKNIFKMIYCHFLENEKQTVNEEELLALIYAKCHQYNYFSEYLVARSIEMINFIKSYFQGNKDPTLSFSIMAKQKIFYKQEKEMRKDQTAHPEDQIYIDFVTKQKVGFEDYKQYRFLRDCSRMIYAWFKNPVEGIIKENELIRRVKIKSSRMNINVSNFEPIIVQLIAHMACQLGFIEKGPENDKQNIIEILEKHIKLGFSKELTYAFMEWVADEVINYFKENEFSLYGLIDTLQNKFFSFEQHFVYLPECCEEIWNLLDAKAVLETLE